MFEGDVDEAERESFYHLIVAADLEHDATVDPEGGMRDTRDSSRQILIARSADGSHGRVSDGGDGGKNEWMVLRRGIGFCLEQAATETTLHVVCWGIRW